ncbi:MAG: flagellar biosynthesis protein FlhB [Treponema sp.]|nr:flagellar biosynthesis protein FlhB [Treponema sp.]
MKSASFSSPAGLRRGTGPAGVVRLAESARAAGACALFAPKRKRPPLDLSHIDLQWFAAEDEGRTEEPTETKIRKAREEGRVAKSPELASSLVMLLGVITLIIAAPTYLRWCLDILRYYFTRCASGDFMQGAFAATFFLTLLKMVLPLSLIGAAGAVAANIVQNRGFIFSTKPIEPQFSKIAPRLGQYLKKTIFSFEGGFNFIKSMVKIGVVSLVGFLIISANLPKILQLLSVPHVYLALSRIALCAAEILVICAVVFLAISVPDYIVQRKQFIESMKMTKQEVKQEYKEQEGDPEVKSHLEQAQRALLQRNMPQAVAESDVVITNPTHFAVSLQYESDKYDAPRVTAKGADELAFRIKSIAKEHDVPVVENRPLARALYAETNVGDIIPEAYISAIVTIYTQIDYLNKKK